jgi:hypothetical protein
VTAGSTSVSAPYVETQGEPVYRDNAWVWPAWLTQNGYIEADVCFVETANPDSRTTIILGATSGIYTPSLEAGAIYRGSGDATASNIIRYTKGYVGGTTLSSYTPASTLFDGAYHKFRLEWVNFTINGARTMNLRLYIDGTQVSFVTSAGTSWATPPVLFPLHAGASTSFQTMKNIVIGVPSIPANAVPEPY